MFLFSSCIRPLITQAPGFEHSPSGGTAIRFSTGTLDCAPDRGNPRPLPRIQNPGGPRSAQGPSIVRPMAGPRGKPQESKTQAAQGQPKDPRLRTRPLGAEANVKSPRPRRPKVSPGPDRGGPRIARRKTPRDIGNPKVDPGTLNHQPTGGFLQSDAPREMHVRSRGSLSAVRVDLKGARQIQKINHKVTRVPSANHPTLLRERTVQPIPETQT